MTAAAAACNMVTLMVGVVFIIIIDCNFYLMKLMAMAEIVSSLLLFTVILAVMTAITTIGSHQTVTTSVIITQIHSNVDRKIARTVTRAVTATIKITTKTI